MEIVHAKKDEIIPRYFYADLVDEYSDVVFRFCRKLTYSKEDAEDLFQETFLKAFEQLPKINAFGNPHGFLLSTCLFIWKSWKRKYARHKRIAPIEPLDETAVGGDQGDQTEERFLAQEETGIVRKLVEALPEKFKIPIILYYTIEMSVTDIASTLKLPSGTVKSRLFKARKLLEKGLTEFYEK